MAEVKVTQTKGLIGATSSQRNSMRSLGLKRIGQTVTKNDTPQVRGMIATVQHLVTVEEV
ncbi:MAG: 50S ribosomal protein L30 [Actinobacteria bacterium]|nr:MAG: 50S ribosomal protein L30 [Actinomycetota bacterium]